MDRLYLMCSCAVSGNAILTLKDHSLQAWQRLDTWLISDEWMVEWISDFTVVLCMHSDWCQHHITHWCVVMLLLLLYQGCGVGAGEQCIHRPAGTSLVLWCHSLSLPSWTFRQSPRYVSNCHQFCLFSAFAAPLGLCFIVWQSKQLICWSVVPDQFQGIWKHVCLQNMSGHFAYLFSTVAASSLVDLCWTWPEENTGEKLIAPAVNITFT